MNFADRMNLALQSQVGTIFIGLIVFLIILGLIYWMMSLRQKKRDILAHLHNSHYQKAKSRATSFDFIGSHKADFFGRQTAVRFKDGSVGLCLIPPPELSEEDVRERYRFFQRAVQQHPLPLLAPHIWKCDDKILILVQGSLLQKEGKFLLNIKHYLKDQRLRETDKERILLEVARALDALHGLHAENGEGLYHGFLLASSLFLEYDGSKTLRRIVLADAGMPFAVGPLKLYQRLLTLREGKLPIEKFRANELLEQIGMLAPEQRDLKHLHEVSPASDFYSFGALAVFLFTERNLNEVKGINWKKIPQKWHSFIKSCLESDTNKRPKSFAELEDWLSDPELALTHHESEDLEMFNRAETKSINNSSEIPLEALPDLLTRIRNTHPAQKQGKEDKLSVHMEAGLKAAKTSKWDIAKKNFKDAIKANPKHAEAHVHYAIACYESGDLKSAEQHYGVAKQCDPRIAKKFRDHIALHI